MEELTSNEKPRAKKRPVILIVAFAIAGLGIMVTLSLLQRNSTFMDYNYTLMMSAKAVNMTCPKMVDDITRLDSVKAKRDRLFTYYYTLTTKSVADLDSTMFCEQWGKNIREASHGHKELSDFGKEGVTLIYVMRDQDAVEFCTVTMPPSDYYIP